MPATRYSPKGSDIPLPLGDPALLRMDVGAASAYSGIKSPIGRRNRKSGARKRSQHETEAARLLAKGDIGARATEF